jgi:hypothetical protein
MLPGERQPGLLPGVEPIAFEKGHVDEAEPLQAPGAFVASQVLPTIRDDQIGVPAGLQVQLIQIPDGDVDGPRDMVRLVFLPFPHVQENHALPGLDHAADFFDPDGEASPTPALARFRGSEKLAGGRACEGQERTERCGQDPGEGIHGVIGSL